MSLLCRVRGKAMFTAKSIELVKKSDKLFPDWIV
jgi:hypothetical protein